ncbi:retinal pigment epithelial membrane protein [Sarocladium implicatum]|nr:retinal pigment epithelial membrane protein [Sarocladium implicatum]
MEEEREHPYLAGNFAPIDTTLGLTPCVFEGDIPTELAGGEYVRNGGNPVVNGDLQRDAHWFDGDGMLSGVLFRRVGEKGRQIQPEFVNQYLLTDIYCYSKQNKSLKKPVLPSIATLVNPARSWFAVLLVIFRAVFLTIVSRLPGRTPIKKISVANTSVVFHDGRALATCESGPPLRFALPGLETVGWFSGREAGNEPRKGQRRSGFGGDGFMSFMREWTTAHPRVDPVTKELIAFHCTFAKPYVRYSIVKPSKSLQQGSSSFDQAVPGVETPKMMHDFGVSRRHTIILDLPLTLDPMNSVRGMPNLCYDTTNRARFGVFPRYAPDAVQWFETNPCLIFHTANCWDTTTSILDKGSDTGFSQTTVHMLACRLTSASMVFQAGNLAMPLFKPVPPEYVEAEQCRLYYYNFPLQLVQGQPTQIKHQWALSAIPFEFPSVSQGKEMQEARFIYGCSTSASFTVALGKAAKIDYLCKIDATALIAKGVANPPQPVKGCVDPRTVQQVAASDDPNDPVKVFAMPKGYYAQEPRFVPRNNAKDEDDGWLLTYVFDESQLDESGHCISDARSELWIVDAKGMKDVVAKIKLPQRVPYGLHGCWFSEDEVESQRPYETVRSLSQVEKGNGHVLASLRDALERWLG